MQGIDIDHFERMASNLGAWVAVMAILIFSGVAMAWSMRNVIKWFLGRIATAVEHYLGHNVQMLQKLLDDHDTHDVKLTEIHADVKVIGHGVERIERQINRAIEEDQ